MYILTLILRSCKIVFGKFEPGPWNMGKASVFVNAWACIWTLFVSIIFILPTFRPVTAETVRLPPSYSPNTIALDNLRLTSKRR